MYVLVYTRMPHVGRCNLTAFNHRAISLAPAKSFCPSLLIVELLALTPLLFRIKQKRRKGHRKYVPQISAQTQMGRAGKQAWEQRHNPGYQGAETGGT